MQLTLRRCDDDDLEALRVLSEDTFRTAFGSRNTAENMEAFCAKAFGADELYRQLKMPGTSFWFLLADGNLAGYLKLNVEEAQSEDMGSSALEIERIYVSADYQGQRLGSYLIEYAIDTARKSGRSSVWLGVWEHNSRAISFYERHGFQPAGTHSFYLGNDRQTDIIMRRELS